LVDIIKLNFRLELQATSTHNLNNGPYLKLQVLYECVSLKAITSTWVQVVLLASRVDYIRRTPRSLHEFTRDHPDLIDRVVR
jgi:hypothetical protein